MAIRTRRGGNRSFASAGQPVISGANLSNGVFQPKTDTATNWAAAAPVLARGEMAVVLDDATGAVLGIKFGDNSTSWSSLPFWVPGASTYRAGLLAGRGAASTYPNSWYFATDDNGGTLYRSDGTSWSAQAPGQNQALLGQRIVSSSISANFTTTSTSDVDVTGLSVTWTAVAGATYTVRFKGAIGNTVSGSSSTLDLTDSANTVLDSVGYQAKSANDSLETIVEADVSPAAGSVTYKTRLKASANTAFVLAGPTFLAKTIVTRVG